MPLGNSRAWLIAIVITAIAYGSFYPFAFTTAAAPADAWLALAHEPLVWTSFPDVVGNVLLFIPLGLCVRLISPRLNPGLVAACCAAFVAYAYAIQVGQYYFAERDPSLSDVVWNSLGCLIGVVGTYAFRHLGPRFHGPAHAAGNAAVFVLIALWLGSEVAPFVPTLDMQHFKDALKPLRSFEVDWVRTFSLACGLACCAELLSVAYGVRRLWASVEALVTIMLLGKLVVETHAWHWATFLALPLAAVLIVATQKLGLENRRLALAALLFSAYTLSEIFPFVLRDYAAPMEWLPFAARLRGNMLTNLDSLFLSLFDYSCILWLLTTQGGRLRGIAIVLALWVFGMEWGQTWLADRTPDATEVVLVVVAAILVAQSRPTQTPPRR